MIVGRNSSGKSNLLDGIKLAFSTIVGDYFKIIKSDFNNSNDSIPINIKVELEPNSIPTLDFYDEQENIICGFNVLIKKTQTGRYIREVSLLNGSQVDFELLRNDLKIPNIYSIPLARVDDIYTDELVTGISTFIKYEDKYRSLVNDSKEAIKKELKDKRDEFQKFCKKFNQNLDIELSEPKISDEKVYIVDGQLEHNYKIGSGYKSIANIILNTLDEKHNIILIDEIENHLHPSLIRTLIRELRDVDNVMIIGTTHSPVVISELKAEELIDISGKKLNDISEINKKRLNIFMHPGRNELILAENIILVEGYTEELLLNHFLYKKNYNWTVINVAGIMFEPYIELGKLLNKKMIVISDNDKVLSDNLESSNRFNNLKKLCKDQKIKLLEVDNTLETDLYNNGYLANYMDLLQLHKNHKEIYVAKNNKKTEIAEKLILDDVDISNWHIIKEILDELESN